MRSERASKLVDAMTGFLLLTNGLSEVGKADGSRALLVVGLGGGACVLAGLILRRKLESRFRHFHAMVAFFEGLMCAVVGAVSMQRGTDYIHFAWFLAAVAFLVAVFVKLRKGSQSPIAEGDAMSEEDVPALVFEGPYAEVLFVQTLIESSGIATSVTDEMRGGRVGFEIRLFVRRADAAHASELVADFRKHGHRTSY